MVLSLSSQNPSVLVAIDHTSTCLVSHVSFSRCFVTLHCGYQCVLRHVRIWCRCVSASARVQIHSHACSLMSRFPQIQHPGETKHRVPADNAKSQDGGTSRITKAPMSLQNREEPPLGSWGEGWLTPLLPEACCSDLLMGVSPLFPTHCVLVANADSQGGGAGNRENRTTQRRDNTPC